MIAEQQPIANYVANDQHTPIIGRYAPSPTGVQHLGNIRTAVLAWLSARLQGGQFIVRMEDLDTPRTVAGSADQILRDLEWLGLDWDGPVEYQSQRSEFYQAALENLDSQGLVYPCFCSRKDIQTALSAPHRSQAVYPGTCCALSKSEIEKQAQQKSAAIRVRVDGQIIEFHDRCLGPQKQNLRVEVGDFVIKRADGLFAYQLAVMVDDIAQGVSEVIRGADLLGSTARQIYLAKKLANKCLIPQYCHVPLMVDSDGRRMAKRDGSHSISSWIENGKSAEQLLASLVYGLGMLESDQPMSPGDMLDAISIEKFHASLS